jgi:16S rRNA (guanine527-N7)-methyltransferase
MDYWRKLKLLDLSKILVKELDNISIKYTEDNIKKLNEYLHLLNKWNKAYNLTAIRNINDMLDKHIVDSLSIGKYIKGNTFIDVGTGPGLPGIPLAILYPDKKFTLLDSNGKKTRFLQQAKIELHLNNIIIVNHRAEEYQPEEKFDGVLSRAFTTLEDMLKSTEHLCKETGYFFAMKGQYPDTELQQITKPYNVQAIHWPNKPFERHLVTISQSTRG